MIRLGAYVAGCRGLLAPDDVWRRDAAICRELGLDVLRFQSDCWDVLEPAPGTFRWERLDEVLDAIGDLELLFTFPISASWNTPRAESMRASARFRGVEHTFDVPPSHFPAPDVSDAARLCDAVARRYRGRLRHYELWNEPDFPPFWCAEPDAEAYVGYATACADAIRSADPDARILMAGLAMPEEPEWFDAFLSLGGASTFDVANIHVYPAFATLDGALRNVRGLMASHGVTKPIWVTETSTTGGYFESDDRDAEERRKADYLERALDAASSEPDVECLIWHTLWNPGTDVGMPRDYDFGLMSSGLEPLPAYHALRRWTSARV